MSKNQLGAIPKIVNNFKPKTSNQNIFYNIIGEEQTQLVLCHGIAGTGKTYVSIYKVYKMFYEEEHHIINLSLSIQP